MNASKFSPSLAKWLRLMTMLTTGGMLAPTVLHAVNPGGSSPPGKVNADNDAQSDEDEDPDAEEGSDCDGTGGASDPSSSSGCGDCNQPSNPQQPGTGGCIKEEIPLSIAPNEPGLGVGKIKLYIDASGANLGSRDYLDFFGSPQMSITEKTSNSNSSELGIVQGGGSLIRFSLPSSKASGQSAAVGLPTGAAGDSLARLTYVDATGGFSDAGGAQSIRQYRSGGGFVTYPLNGGRATSLETKQGRKYSFPLATMEIIREKPDGTLVPNGTYGQGLIRQVKTAAGLLDMVQLSERSYEVRTYGPSQVGAKVGGLFTVNSAPFFVMKVEAPAGTQNELVVTKTEGSLSTVARHTVTVDGTTESWRQEVTAGSFKYNRLLTREVAADLGAAYRRSNWSAGLLSVPSGTSAYGGQQAYALSSVTYNGAMVSSTQNFSSGAIFTRERSRSIEVRDNVSSVSRPTSQKQSSGSALTYAYDASTSRMSEKTSFFEKPSGSGGGRRSKQETFLYASHLGGESLAFYDFSPRTVIIRQDGQVTDKLLFAAVYTNGVYKEIRETAGALQLYGDPTNQREEKEWYGPGEHQGRLKQELKKDGTLTRYDYVTKPANALEVTTHSKLDASGNPVSGYSTRVRELRDARAWPVETTTAAWTGSAWVDYETIYQTRNEAGRLTREEREDKLSGQRRVTLLQEWDGPMLTRKVDEQGIATSYEYFNGTTVVKTARREAIPAAGNYPAQPEIVTTYTGSFTINEEQVPEWKNRTTAITSGGLTLTEHELFDEKGRVVSYTDKNGYTTTTAYSEEDKVKTETLPRGATRITRTDSEGRLLSVTGTAVVAEYHYYESLSQGGERQTIYTGVDGGARYQIIERDGLKRIIQEIVPSFGGGQAVTAYTYSLTHPQSVVAVTKTGQATKVCELNAVGACVREGLTVDDAILTLASATDRISDMATTIEQDANGLWKVTRASVYPEAGSATSKIVITTRTKLGGFTGIEIERTETADIVGNVTTERTLLSGTIREVRIARPGITGEEATIYHGKHLMSVTRPGITGEVAFGYDALGRNVSRKEPRHTQASTTAYISGTNLLASQTDAAGDATSYSYYQQGVKGAGEVKSITLPDNSVKWTAYNLRDEVQAEWGSQTYLTWKEYDAYGKLVTLRTWQVAPTLNADSMPTDAPEGSAVTIWNYDPASGLLTNKRYADNKGSDYSYDAAGRLVTRLWARLFNSARLATHYTWNGFGELTAVDYADETPDVAIAYDRLGRPTSQGNGVAVSIFTYSSATLRLSSEGITYDLDRDGAPDLVRQLDRSQDAHLRPAGYQLKNGTTVETQAAYGYDNAGLIERVDGGDLGAFTYGYVSGSSLIGKVTGPVHTVTNTYEPNRDVLTFKENNVGETVISAYGYTMNALGQRTHVSQTGTAFASNRSTAWGYDGLGQVISADSSVAGHDRAYQYDAIGNRKKSADSVTLPGTDNYTPNALNQYSAINNQLPTISPSYDADGNATAYPLPIAPTASSTLAWDGENRLIETFVGTGGPLVRYFYDSRSRRIAKITGDVVELTVHDGRNPIVEYSRSVGTLPALFQSYTWGSDLSGTLQGAGGVGGLLSLTTNNQPSTLVYFPTYDGNGNVSEYLASDGAAAAHFEYDAFGRVVLTTGSASNFAVRFSTKKEDAESGLNYYGHRYYDARLGRWLSRDSLEEWGGVNLYCGMLNSTIDFVDINGHSAAYWGAVAAAGARGAAVGSRAGVFGAVAAAGAMAIGAAAGEAANAIQEAIESQEKLDKISEESKKLQERLENESRGHTNLPHSKGEARQELQHAQDQLAGNCPPPGGGNDPKWKDKLKQRIKALEKMLGIRGNSQK